jgi:hypothetical protein
MKTLTHWIDGRPVESTSGRHGGVGLVFPSDS